MSFYLANYEMCMPIASHIHLRIFSNYCSVHFFYFSIDGFIDKARVEEAEIKTKELETLVSVIENFESILLQICIMLADTRGSCQE